jgi:uncharacterized protein YoxC
MIIILFLILFFLILILNQIFSDYFQSTIIEGMIETISSTNNPNNEIIPNVTINQVYRQYDKKIPDNTFLMTQQNAGNIEYLKQRMDSVQNIFKEVQDLSGNVSTLQDQLNGLLMTQKQYASQITGDSVPNITGTGIETGTDIETETDIAENEIQTSGSNFSNIPI